MTDADFHTVEQLRQVAARYATGVDRRDRGRFLDAFHADATLSIFNDGQPGGLTRELRGHDQLASIVERIARYPTTFHLLGQSSYEIAGAEATGEVYCVAHHRLPRDESATEVMYIRYLDRYRRGADDVWRIATRRVVVDWRETRASSTEVVP